MQSTLIKTTNWRLLSIVFVLIRNRIVKDDITPAEIKYKMLLYSTLSDDWWQVVMHGLDNLHLHK